MAYKVFSNGDALTGSELNTYLMNQAVISFATTTARDAALPSPSEGQLVWLEDSNKYVYYTGSAWADLITPASSGNAIINGAFDIWQRGTSFTASGYTADRYNLLHGVSSGVSVTQQTFTPGAAPVAGYEGRFYMDIAGTITNTATGYITLLQKIENVRSFAGQTITYSFWAKGSTSGTISTALNQNFGSGGSPSSDIWVGNSQHSITTSWQRFTVTIAVPSISGKTLGTNNDHNLNLVFTKNIGTDYQANYGPANYTGTLSIWGVQIEAGSTATAFKRNGANIADELASCQRYYQRYQSNGLSYALFGFGYALSTTNVAIGLPLPVTMRVQPTSVEWSNLRDTDLGNTYPVTSLSLSGSSSTQFAQIDATASGGGMTQYRPYFISGNNSTSAYIGFSAEL